MIAEPSSCPDDLAIGAGGLALRPWLCMLDPDSAKFSQSKSLPACCSSLTLGQEAVPQAMAATA